MVSISPTTALPDHDDDNAKRRQILRGARAVFMDLGFDGASMGEIARAAGVSKGTLYVYFTDKNSLFCEIIEQESAEQGMLTFDFPPDRDVETSLKVFGAAYTKLLCDPRHASAIRTVMAIAERMPEVGQRYYERVIANSLGRFTRYLEQQVQAGTLAIDNCYLAASQFTKLCQATLFLPYIFQVADVPSPDRIAEVVDSATRMFMATYRASGKPAYSSSEPSSPGTA
ncbi:MULTISPECIES: TetR/AcrR family transcriptional regulator [Rhodopseudomonas]|uniref:TetR/AcrR family transcriptional regulator n=1 Tax=Rhodopseudomonas TaxID=1073 RepID=UPI0005C873DD|nr:MULTISPECIES: TetR/AcrR family transcriptional regulator [Rhodopseudomonas]MDF3812848.1 TetR/AcrR family transcriptional regulator [Rhodopseudomonas sp. BAL398]WOK18302.1 TetR/AcrR family transcriptional regulator [Rhodopseudomonas sp. BAL398]